MCWKVGFFWLIECYFQESTEIERAVNLRVRLLELEIGLCLFLAVQTWTTL